MTLCNTYGIGRYTTLDRIAFCTYYVACRSNSYMLIAIVHIVTYTVSWMIASILYSTEYLLFTSLAMWISKTNLQETFFIHVKWIRRFFWIRMNFLRIYSFLKIFNLKKKMVKKNRKFFIRFRVNDVYYNR